MARSLNLLGTVHTDPHGLERLVRAIDYIQPDHITFELLPEKIADYGFSQEYALTLTASLYAEGTLLTTEDKAFHFYEALRTYGFEAKIARILQELGNIEISYVDEPISEQEEDELISIDESSPLPERPETIQSHEMVSFFVNNFLIYDLQLSAGLSNTITTMLADTFFNQKQQEEILSYRYELESSEKNVIIGLPQIKRDRAMAARIIQHWQKMDGTLLHVGGLFHVYGSYHNLYDRLSNFSPIRYKLNEFS